MDMDIDSDDKGEMTNQLRKMANQKVTQRVDARFKPPGEPEGKAIDDLIKKGITIMTMAPAFLPAEPIAQDKSFMVNSSPLSDEDASTKHEGVVALVAVSDTDYTFRANGKITTNFEGSAIKGNAIDNIILDRKTGMVKNTFGTVSPRGSDNVQGAQTEISSNTVTPIRLLQCCTTSYRRRRLLRRAYITRKVSALRLRQVPSLATLYKSEGNVTFVVPYEIVTVDGLTRLQAKPARRIGSRDEIRDLTTIRTTKC